MNQILCSTGALIGIPNGRDYRLLEKLSGKLNCDGYEFMMYSSWYGKEEEIADFLKQSGLNIPVMHCEKHIGECISRNEEGDLAEAIWKFRKNCEVARKVPENLSSICGTGRFQTSIFLIICGPTGSWKQWRKSMA